MFAPNKYVAKELVIASLLQQHLVPSTESVQMIPLKFSKGMIHQWRAHGYTYLHYGTIRLALNLHGRKSLLVVARVVLHDTRYKQYQHASIAILHTALNACTIFITLFQKFYVAREDLQIYQKGKSSCKSPALHKWGTHMLQHFTIKWLTESKTMR